jgi:hypothetical protein
MFLQHETKVNTKESIKQSNNQTNSHSQLCHIPHQQIKFARVPGDDTALRAGQLGAASWLDQRGWCRPSLHAQGCQAARRRGGRQQTAVLCTVREHDVQDVLVQVLSALSGLQMRNQLNS